MELKFYKDGEKVFASYEELDLEKLEVGVVDAAREKHIPEVSVNGNQVNVQVGSVIHPMLENHYITFILLETDKGLLQQDLKPGQEPVATFVLEDGVKPLAAYEHCNLHGVWKKEL